MDTKDDPGSELARPLLLLLATACELLGEEDGPLASWHARVADMGAAEGEGIRVAVAGTVKSGKSTLVNALIGQDLLKRGAGIVTSLVTRVRPGTELRARVELKGWAAVNREATDAALFLGGGEDGRPVDLRSDRDRAVLVKALGELGEEALGEGGFFDKNVALLQAYLDGYARVRSLLGDGPRVLDLAGSDFPRHREFAGEDALAAYVDDLVIEVPGLPFGTAWELADCQGYDSPNPRHMEKVQEYLLGAHLVVYAVSSRVGLREADLRFLRDIKALGLLGSTRFVLNADLGEHASAGELEALRARLAAELKAIDAAPEIHAFSALRALLEGLRASGQVLSRKDELFLEVWSEAGVEDGPFELFRAGLADELGPRRQARLLKARTAVLRGARDVLKGRVEAALGILRREVKDLEAGESDLSRACERVRRSLASFEAALRSVSEGVRRDMFRKIDGSFHPSGGGIAAEVFAEVRSIEPPPSELEVTDKKQLLRQMARVYQEMRADFHRFKVEAVNPRAVERIRGAWGEASRELAEAALAPADLLVQSVDAYRREAQSLGVSVPELELPVLDPSIGKRPIALFSAVTYAPAESSPDRVVSFAGQWTRKVALGWAKRLVGKKEKTTFAHSLLADGAEAVRELLLEEARSNLIQYAEQVKFQVLGPGLEELGTAWASQYRDTVAALALDLDRLAEGLRGRGEEHEDLIPRLEGVLAALAPLGG